MGDAETIAMKKQQLEESLRALDYYKGQNEEALRQALKKDEAVKKHTKATSKDAIKRERVEWLQRIVDEESTKPLQVPKNYVKGYTEQATEYSRQIANNNARRSYTLAKIEDGAKKRSTRREREKEYKRRWNATKGEGSSALSNASGSLNGEEDEDGALDEISQLAAQVRTQAERHAVDGSLPLETTGLGQDMLDEFSLVSTADEPAVRQTVFRKKRTESSLGSPAQSYYTVKQTASEGDLSMGQSSEHGDDSGGPQRRSGRSRGSSRGSGLNNTMSSMASMNSTMPRDHIEKLEMQRASIRAQRELSKRHAEESRIKLAESERRADQVIRAWSKKQGDLNKAKNRAYRQRIARDRRFIEDCQAVVQHVRTWDSTPPVELMHASTSLAKLKKEEKRAKKEGRSSVGIPKEEEQEGAGEDGGPPKEVKTVMEMRANVTIGGSKKGAKGKPRKKTADTAAEGEEGEEAAPAPAPAPVVAAPPSFNPLAASGYDLNVSTGGAKVPLEVDSHMLLDEETEFQISRLESQQDDLEDWSRSLQHQLPTIAVNKM